MGSRSFLATAFLSLCVASTAFGAVFPSERVESAHGLVSRQVLGMGDSKDEWCDRIDFVDKTITCASTAKLYYGSAKKPITTAKTTSADYTVKVSTSGRAAGITRTCTEILAGDWVLDQLINSDACSTATQKTNGGTVMTNVKKLLNGVSNRNYIQKTRLETIKKSLDSDTIDVPKLKKSIIDSLVVINYFEKNQQATTTLAGQIDKMVQSGVGVNPGVSAAWSKKMAKIKTVKTSLLAQLQKDIQQKQKQAKEATNRKDQCGASTGTSTGKTTTTGKAARMERRHLVSFTPETTLELAARLQKAARSGPNAPAAPACPLKSGNGTKKVVPRSKTSTKAAPAKTPRTPAKRPKAKAANPKKQVVKRPASRARRTPGKAAPKRRVTPKKKPKVVPKPARKPKGKARARRRK